jgi:hypothetical protein
MRLQELASLMKISKDELIKQLKQTDVIELKLTEKSVKETKDYGTIEILK